MSFTLQEDRTHGSSNWAAFDDLATQRPSQLDSVFEQSEKTGPQNPPQASGTDAQAASAQPSSSGDDWNAFGSTSTSWGSAEGSSHADSMQQSPPSASWAAFDDPASVEGKGGSSQQPANTSGTHLHEPGQQTAGHQSEGADPDLQMQNADFGGSNYWRTHPLALVDEVE